MWGNVRAAGAVIAREPVHHHPAPSRPTTLAAPVPFCAFLCEVFARFLQGFGEVFARFLRGFCAIFARFWRGFCEVFARFLRGFCEIFARFWRGFCEVFARFLRDFCKVLARFWRGFGIFYWKSAELYSNNKGIHPYFLT
jgi:hypothetical protein